MLRVNKASFIVSEFVILLCLCAIVKKIAALNLYIK